MAKVKLILVIPEESLVLGNLRNRVHQFLLMHPPAVAAREVIEVITRASFNDMNAVLRARKMRQTSFIPPAQHSIGR